MSPSPIVACKSITLPIKRLATASTAFTYALINGHNRYPAPGRAVITDAIIKVHFFKRNQNSMSGMTENVGRSYFAGIGTSSNDAAVALHTSNVAIVSRMTLVIRY